MCGISGVVYKRENSDWGSLISMKGHQTHRGPDSSGHWTDAYCGLAHNRLSIIDLSEHGAQPMESATWVLCYNGEIYNHNELRKKINREWTGTSDTETLLYHIEVFGIENTAEAIEGMFAFAAYHKSSTSLYLVTDPAGIKPLYYHAGHERFLFASTIGAIALQLSGLRIDQQALIDYLALGSTRQPLFVGVSKVMPGTTHCVKLSNGDFIQTTSEYWKPKTGNHVSEGELINIVEASVESIKLSDVPLFLFLSGGVDSSFVAGCLPGINAVHLASPEQYYAKQVADKFDSTLTVIDPKREDAEICLRDYSFKSGDCSMAALIPYITSKHSAKFGKVAISANGADELFFGYNRTMENVTTGQIDHIFRRHFFDQSSWRDLIGDDGRHLELSTYVAFDLNKTLDYASMCHGLEVRVPFLNRSVIEAALSLGRPAHVNGLGMKSILKKWLLDKGFSKSFVNRPKLGFSLHSDPFGYDELKRKGIELLASEFGVRPSFPKNSRDARYFEASAASFYCWFQVWFGNSANIS